MGRSHHALETSPDLVFIKSGVLNMVLYKANDELLRVPVDSAAFLEDKRVVRSVNMDQVTFHKHVVFKFTLDFIEPLPCIEETAVRESTEWVLCSCEGGNAFYSKVEQRLVLQQCFVSLQSNVVELIEPFSVVLRLDDDEWVVERVLR